MKKTFKIGLLVLLITGLTLAFAGQADATTWRQWFQEISAPSGDPPSNKGWLYIKDNSGTSALFFEDDSGTVTLLGASGGVTLDGAYTGGNTITLDASGDFELDTNPDSNAGTFVFDTITGSGALDDAFQVTTTSGSVTDALDMSDAGITNALNVGANVIIGTGGASINFDAFDVDASGNVTIGGNLSITGTWSVDAIAAATATQTLTLDGDTSGGVSIGVTSTGNVTLGDDVVVSDTFNVTIGEGSLTVDDDANEDAVVIEASATTTGSALKITASVTTDNVIEATADDLGTGGAMIHLDTDNIATDNFYIEAFNGSGNEFTVSRYGATVIAGNASTDVLTLTAGDIQISNGDIDMDVGVINVDTTANQGNSFARNQGTTTTDLLTLTVTDASDDEQALYIDCNQSADVDCVIIDNISTGQALNLNLQAVTTDGIEFLVPASYTGQLIKMSDTFVGTSAQGAIDLHTTANMATGSSLIRLDSDTGQLAGATGGFMLNIDDDSTAQATSYAVLINSNANEALHVELGESLFAELTHHTLGIDADAGIDVDLAANTETVNITGAAADYAAGSGVVTVYDDSTGQANASYLFRGAREANGDAQDGFLLFEDNSTGADNNGDNMLEIGAHGTITMGGTSGEGGSLIYSFEDLTIDTAGTAASVVTVLTIITTDGDGNEDDATLGDGVKGQVKIFIIAVEGAGGDTWKITPANLNGGSKISFDGVIGDGCTMIFDGTSWTIIGNTGGTIS